jgi:cysteine desulfurase
LSRGLPIYADAHATTPCDPSVVAAMLPFFSETFGNASSLHHRFGRAAHEAVERARSQVAVLAGAGLRDVVFTSGATEANNLALRGVVEASGGPGGQVITVATEHPAVLDTCTWLEAQGTRVVRLPVRPDGLLDPAALGAALTPDTRLVSVMAANHEIGVLQPLAELAALAHQAGAWFHTDASQAFGKVPLDMGAMGIDLLSCTAHKIYGPKGTGALIVRRKSRVPVAPLLHGGGHERGLRSGTLNVPAIVGFGEASRLARERMSTDAAHLGRLRDRLWSMLESALPGVRLRGAREPRLPHNLNVGFEEVRSRDLLLALDDVAVSPGAACASTSADASHVLRALGLSEDEARSSLRIGLLRTATEADVDHIVARLTELVPALRAERGALR